MHFNEPFVCAEHFNLIDARVCRNCKVCEMKIKKKRKKIKQNKILVAHILGLAGEVCFKFGMWSCLPRRESQQQIWCNSGKRSWSYKGVKMTFSFFLSIYSWCDMPAS